jgi:EAL domain-containing protein (putative c-di-GMP-specific phosphodiesterase class I)
MDDFGIGYSSIGQLKRFPIDRLKLDRTFVRDLPEDINDIAITRAVIAMAHTLQIGVVAEGVERQAQLDLLRAEGCDEYQGYLCQPPLTAAELVRFVRDGATDIVPAVEIVSAAAMRRDARTLAKVTPLRPSDADAAIPFTRGGR